MPSKDVHIFGKQIRLAGGDSEIFDRLLQEMSIYPSTANGDPDINVSIGRLAALPTDNCTVESNFGTARVAFDLESRSAFVEVHDSRIPGIELMRKWRNMQFSNRRERIGMIIHENVLIPLFFFVPGYVPLHGATVVPKDGGAVLFGGHGGTGKTTMELELCLHHSFSFLADDFSPISSDGLMYPNLAYPKIYGYNLVGNERLQRIFTSNQTSMDAVHWRYHLSRGLDKVRRRFAPTALYHNVSRHPVQLSKYYFLIRDEETKELQLDKLSSTEICALTIEVLQKEYSGFFGDVLDAGIPLPQTRWQQTLEQALQSVDCYRVAIPRTMSNVRYKSIMTGIVLDT